MLEELFDFQFFTDNVLRSAREPDEADFGSGEHSVVMS
jgi:hypothetical protein